MQNPLPKVPRKWLPLGPQREWQAGMAAWLTWAANSSQLLTGCLCSPEWVWTTWRWIGTLWIFYSINLALPCVVGEACDLLLTRIWTAPGLMWKHWQVSGNSWTLHTWLSMTCISKQFWISSLLQQCQWPSRAKPLCGPKVVNHTPSSANDPQPEICLCDISKRQRLCLGTD